MFALLIPTLLSVLVLAAHFLRGGHTYLVFFALSAPWLLVLRRRWATRTLQAVLILGALEWVRTTLQIQAVRVEMGRDWQRMALILYSVAAFTFASSLLYFLPPMRRHYCRPRGDAGIDTPAGAVKSSA